MKPTTEQAREILNEWADNYIDDSPHHIVLQMGADALEKQIPKKPIINSDYGFNMCECPVCGSEAKDTYCRECGQKIDWGDN